MDKDGYTTQGFESPVRKFEAKYHLTGLSMNYTCPENLSGVDFERYAAARFSPLYRTLYDSMKGDNPVPPENARLRRGLTEVRAFNNELVRLNPQLQSVRRSHVDAARGPMVDVALALAHEQDFHCGVANGFSPADIDYYLTRSITKIEIVDNHLQLAAIVRKIDPIQTGIEWEPSPATVELLSRAATEVTAHQPQDLPHRFIRGLKTVIGDVRLKLYERRLKKHAKEFFDHG
jgi:hypothetical protein